MRSAEAGRVEAGGGQRRRDIWDRDRAPGPDGRRWRAGSMMRKRPARGPPGAPALAWRLFWGKARLAMAQLLGGARSAPDLGSRSQRGSRGEHVVAEPVAPSGPAARVPQPAVGHQLAV
ncbi:hypothetical protein HPB50_007416 [Hyalomma asiaticum]|uniref:Uncharacterized protein n=1 Tax=Hyalomma asiaticum TaxID=266040 RepID=A0ACB7TGI2_HYAAI|nr:hypothetical protein HPB50_007416 [Hyalomma asiaticum]